ncbi:hypothetical protein GGH96_003062 [Coemansia sp. RSA 1972]|nr:hypothetical protein GGH96_003062 [Coemansia sp. RSA 1972]
MSAHWTVLRYCAQPGIFNRIGRRCLTTQQTRPAPQLYQHQRALIFPGQGSQFVGMGMDLNEQFSAARHVFQEADDVLGFHLSRLMFGGDPAELMLTKNAQPAIVAVSVAATRALEDAAGMDASTMYSATMGHSVGEYSALVAAHAISFADALRLVRVRGKVMQDAVGSRDFAMCACILRRAQVADVVADVEQVQHEIQHMGAGEVVQVANINSSSQVVLSGTRTAVDRAITSLQSKRLAMRAVNLPVSAPFHCSLMAPAKAVLATCIQDMAPIHDSTVWTMPVISNVTGCPHESAATTQTLLAEQVDSPVLWLQSMQYLKDICGISRWGAMGPGSVVGNLAGKEFTHDIVRRLSDADAICKFVAVMGRQLQRGH